MSVQVADCLLCDGTGSNATFTIHSQFLFFKWGRKEHAYPCPECYGIGRRVVDAGRRQRDILLGITTDYVTVGLTDEDRDEAAFGTFVDQFAAALRDDDRHALLLLFEKMAREDPDQLLRLAVFIHYSLGRDGESGSGPVS